MLRFTGEYIDWEATSAVFCGIFGAKLTVEGTAESETTAPNGRFDLCVPDAPTSLVDITPPTAPSQCTQPAEMYVLPAIAVANKAVIEAGGAWSGRAFGTAQQVVVDPAKAQVFVHVNGSPTQVSIAAPHGPSQAMVNGTWVPGDTANEVFFPDVDATSGSTNLTAGSAIGAGPTPLVVGKMTNVSIIAP